MFSFQDYHLLKSIRFKKIKAQRLSTLGFLYSQKKKSLNSEFEIRITSSPNQREFDSKRNPHGTSQFAAYYTCV